MAERKDTGREILIDHDASSARPARPAFLASPEHARVYHGFPIIEQTRTSDGWCFGAITEFVDPEGCDAGDAFVVAPDGSRAGIVWHVGEGTVTRVSEPDATRWGVYSVWFGAPVRTVEDFTRELHAVLPRLREIRHAILVRHASDDTGSGTSTQRARAAAHFKVKLSWVWRMIGPVFVAIGAAYPFLVTSVELRRLDKGDAVPPLALFALGIWFSWLYSHSITVSESGLTFRSLFNSTIVPWEDIERFERSDSWLTVRDRSGRRHRVSADAERATVLEEQLRDRLTVGGA